MATDRERIGMRIAKLRKAKGLTQAGLAGLTGVHPGNIARIETGKYSTGLDILSKIASAIDCKFDIVSNTLIDSK